MQQQRLPFESIEKARHQLIDQITPWACPLSGCRCGGVRRLLRTIWLQCSDGGGVSRAYVATLARCLGVSPRTVRYWQRDAENLGVLHIRAVRRPGRGQVNNLYQVDWDALEEFGQRSAKQLAGAPANLAGAPANLAARLQERGAGKGGIQPSRTTMQETSTAQPNAAGDTAGGGDTAGWAEAEEALEQAGLTLARQAAQTAREKGLAAQAVIEAVALWRANRQRLRSPGAIAFWIRNGAWPAEGLLTPQQRDLARRKTSSDEARKQHRRAVFKFLRAAQQAGWTRERAEAAARARLNYQ